MVTKSVRFGEGVKGMTFVSKDRLLSHICGEANCVLQTAIGGNANGAVFKLLLTYYFENGMVKQSISMGKRSIWRCVLRIIYG